MPAAGGSGVEREARGVFAGEGPVAVLVLAAGEGFTVSGAPIVAAASPAGVAAGGTAGGWFAGEAASPLIERWGVGRFEIYQKIAREIAMSTMAAMATPGRLRDRGSISSRRR